MQLSTNSNKQIEWLVKAQPTLIGQHRQAYLQRLDREQALVKAQYDLRKHEVNIKLKESEISLQRNEAQKAEAAGDLEVSNYLNLKMQLLKIELEEMTAGLSYINLQISDAERELNEAQKYMDEACRLAGVNFEKLDEETYQDLLAENVLITTGRRLSSQVVAQTLGLPQSVVETLAEMPEGDRKQMLSQVPYQLSLINRAVEGVFNPMVNLKELSHAH
jgi:hypothetical protein